MYTIKDGNVTYTINNGTVTAIDLPEGEYSIAVPHEARGILPSAFSAIAKQDKPEAIDKDKCKSGSGAKKTDEAEKKEEKPDVSVVLGEGVGEIGNAFSGLKRLGSLKLNRNIKAIGRGAFSDCSSLVSLTGTEAVRTVGKDAFSGCEGLTRVYLPALSLCVAPVESVDDNIKGFRRMRLKAKRRKEQLRRKEEALRDFVFDAGLCRSCAVDVGDDNPDFLTREGSLYDKNCKILYFASVFGSEFVIPDGVERIARDAFRGAEKLERVIIPSSLKVIDPYAFAGCLSLKTLANRCGAVSDGDKRDEGAELVQVRVIGEHAFDGCRSLERVDIRGAVKIGDFAFSRCLGLVCARLPQELYSVPDGLFHKCPRLSSVNLSKGLRSVGSYAFSGCRDLCLSLKSKKLTYVGEHAFSYVGLKELELKNPRIRLCDYAFYHCVRLEFASLPLIGEISDHLFEACVRLRSVRIACDKDKGRLSIGRYAFSGCESLGELSLPRGGVRFVGRYALSRVGLAEFVIPDSLTEVEDGAFAGCRGLSLRVANDHPKFSSVNGDLRSRAGDVLYFPRIEGDTYRIPNGIIELAPKALERMEGVRRIEIGRGVYFMGECAFASMPELEEAVFEDGELTTLPSGAFALCYSLKSVRLPKSLRRIESGAFCRCISLSRLTYSGAAVPVCASFEEDFSEACPSVDAELAAERWRRAAEGEVAAEQPCEPCLLPEGLVHIGNGAFLEARSLTSLVIPSATSQIERRAFAGCRSLRICVCASSRDYAAKDGSLYRRVRITDGDKVINSLSLHFFSNPNGADSIALPEGVGSLCYGALTRLGTGIKSVDLSATPICKIGKSELAGTGGERLTVITRRGVVLIERKPDKKTRLAKDEKAGRQKAYRPPV